MKYNDENNSELLLNLIKAVNSSSNLNEIYKVVINSVVKLNVVDMTAIYLVNEYSLEAILVAQKNFPKSYLKKASIIPKPRGLTWKVIETGKLLIVDDVRKDPHIEDGKITEYRAHLKITFILEG